MVETTRLELVTSTMSTWRSNQLGYASKALTYYYNFGKMTSTFDQFIKKLQSEGQYATMCV